MYCRLSNSFSFSYSLVVMKTQMFFLAIVTNLYNNNNNNSRIAQMKVKQKQSNSQQWLAYIAWKAVKRRIHRLVFNHRYWLIELFIFRHKFNQMACTPQHAMLIDMPNAECWMSNVELILLGFVSHDCSFVDSARTFLYLICYIWFLAPLHFISFFGVNNSILDRRWVSSHVGLTCFLSFVQHCTHYAVIPLLIEWNSALFLRKNLALEKS